MDIVLDFDGTCVVHDFPNIQTHDIGSAPVLKELIANGHRLILHTMRGTRSVLNNKYYDFLTPAVQWFKDNDIKLWSVEEHPTQHLWTNAKKCYGDFLIDDRAIGCPLKRDNMLSTNAFVDWVKMRELLVENGLIRN